MERDCLLLARLNTPNYYSFCRSSWGTLPACTRSRTAGFMLKASLDKGGPYSLTSHADFCSAYSPTEYRELVLCISISSSSSMAPEGSRLL